MLTVPSIGVVSRFDVCGSDEAIDAYILAFLRQINRICNLLDSAAPVSVASMRRISLPVIELSRSLLLLLPKS